MDRTDWEPRPWLGLEGWPIAHSDLDPFWERTLEELQIDAYDYRLKDRWVPWTRPLVQGKSGDRFMTKPYHFSKPANKNLGRKYMKAFAQSKNVDVLTNATVTRINVNEQGNRATDLSVQTFEGKKFRVRAKRFVLASGGIENARLLLMSNDRHSEGLGNLSDQVGRNFADHYSVEGGVISIYGPQEHVNTHYRHVDPYVGFKKTLHYISPKIETQRELRAQNFGFRMLRAEYKEKGTDSAAAGLFSQVKEQTREWTDRLEEKLFFTNVHQHLGVLSPSIEPIPNPESRVTLTNEKDRMGLPVVSVDFKLTDRDYQGIRRTFVSLAKELGAQSKGRLKVLLRPETEWKIYHPDAKKHHLGTTRMGSNPKTSVVNGDARLHEVDNVYLAGSSVFPTYGFAGPTPSVIAMAFRLAEHLKGESQNDRA